MKPHVTQAIILAAGDGTRLKDYHDLPKVLLPLLGRTLLERHLSGLSVLGIEHFVIVTGYRAEAVESFIFKKRLDRRHRITLIHNPQWEVGNARSVWVARDVLDERFLLVMGDHCYDTAALSGLLGATGEFIAACDLAPCPHIDLADATKVHVQDGCIVELGKHLSDFCGVDAGAFACSRRILPFIEDCLTTGHDEWNDVKCAWLARHSLLIHDLRGAFWADLDTATDVRTAQAALVKGLTRPRDGLIARLINRHLSISLSLRLIHTPLTANHISFLAFIVTAVAALCFGRGTPMALIAGGLLAQIASILDGCDGEVARLLGTSSPYGAWLDAVLDRVADAILFLGMSVGFDVTHPGHHIWPLAFFALGTSLILSYTETRYEASFRRAPDHAGGLPIKRDTRLFLVMLGGLLNQVPLTLAVIATLCLSEIVRRIWVYRPASASFDACP